MQDHVITAYEGSENYIFISYAHKDTDTVIPILRQLQDRGYRVWYDDGIAPGSEWPENIAQHLDGAAMVVAFISPNSMASPNCRREINFALSRQKPFLSVVLEPTEMPLGMELQLSAQQSVIRYNYRTEEQFIQKICSCPDLACCQERQELPEPDQVTEEKAAEEPIPVPEKPKKAPKPPKPPKPQKTERTRTAKKPGKTLGMIAGALALIILIIVAVSAINTVHITEEKSVNRGETYLSLWDLTVDSEILDRISKLKKLESLTFTQCRFEADALARWNTEAPLSYIHMEDCEGDLNLTFLTGLTELTRLSIQNCGLTDQNLPALDQPGLTQVCLNDNPGLTDLSKLSGLEKLQQLEIVNTGVQSLEEVAGSALRKIDFSGTPVTDVAVLANCPELAEVSGADSGVTDIAPLARLPQLVSLEFSGCDLSGLSPELRFESLRLHTLKLQNTGITTLAPFSNLTQITTAYLGYNDLDNGELQILEKSTGTLKYLNLSGTGFRSDEGTWLAECQNMQALYLDKTLLADLSFVKGMTALTKFSAWSCGLRDISDLGNCTALTNLCLAENDMENLDGLAAIPLERSDYARFDFTGCENLTDISGLPEVEYSKLCLAGCPNIDYGTAGNISGQTIILNYNATFAGSHLETKPFSGYYILDCPADQKVALEDLLGSYRVKYVTYGQELARIMAEELEMSCAHLRESE